MDGYTSRRIDTDENGVVVSNTLYRFPSKHYYDLWAKFNAVAIDNDAQFNNLWAPFYVKE